VQIDFAFIVLLLSLVWLGGCVVVGFSRRSFRAARFSAMAVLLALCGEVTGSVIGAFQQRATDANAMQIVDALRQYKMRHLSGYPAQLTDLAPAYFAKIPATHMGFGGEPFEYAAAPGKSAEMRDQFTLRYRLGASLTRAYDSREGKWSTINGAVMQ